MKSQKLTLTLAALFVACTLSLFAGRAEAQAVPGTLVQQSPTDLAATTLIQHSHTSAATITITGTSGQSVYVTGIDITNCAGTTVTSAAPLFITTTGLNGSPQYMVGTGGTAGICNPSSMLGFAKPLKQSTAGANVTFVLPTFTANQTVSVNVYYYIAP